MKTVKRLLTVALLAALAPTAWALETGDVIRMTKAQVGDEVIKAQIEAEKARFELSADAIIRLKEEGVSDAIIKAMIETAGRTDEAGEEPAADAAEAGDAPEIVEEPTGDGQGTLILENLDSRSYSVQVDSTHGRIFYYGGVATEGREALPARSSQVWNLPAGRYDVRWVAEDENHTVLISAGRESKVTLTRTTTEGSEALYVSLFEDGQRRGGGRLVTLVDQSPAEAVGTAAAPPTTVIEKHYYAQPAAAPAPVYVQGSPGYCYQPSSSYYSQPSYRHSSYRRSSNWLIPGLAYSWKRGKSRYTLGWDSYGNTGFSYGRKLGRSGYTLNWGW